MKRPGPARWSCAKKPGIQQRNDILDKPAKTAKKGRQKRRTIFAKKPPAGTDSDLNSATLSAILADEDEARRFLESKRWPGRNIVCPHCGGDGYGLTARPGSKRPGGLGLKKCKACRRQFTVRVATIFEESKVPLRNWLAAIHLMTTSKKGISSHQIAREVGITQKSAWFLCHRIRDAMRREPMLSMLAGDAEIDGTHVRG